MPLAKNAINAQIAAFVMFSAVFAQFHAPFVRLALWFVYTYRGGH
jgi:hypothetical protein